MGEAMPFEAAIGPYLGSRAIHPLLVFQGHELGASGRTLAVVGVSDGDLLLASSDDGVAWRRLFPTGRLRSAIVSRIAAAVRSSPSWARLEDKRGIKVLITADGPRLTVRAAQCSSPVGSRVPEDRGATWVLCEVDR